MDQVLTAGKDEIVSYAQNREDLTLHVLLHGVKSGYYIDVGANGPIVDSVTYYFYLRGWRGINIEPNPTHIKALKKLRPHDVNLQLAIGSQEGEGRFREYLGKSHGLSTLSPAMKKGYVKQKLKFHEYPVKVVPLRDIFKKYLKKNQVIDFLKIDVEGLEYEVIESNDWLSYRPRIVVIESNHIKKDWRDLIISFGYKKVFFDGLNEYYSSDEFVSKIDFSVYPEVVTERGSILSYQQLLQRNDLTKRLVKKHNRQLYRLKGSLEKEKDIATQRKDKLDWIYEHPSRFVLDRLYHNYVKRDQKKEFTEL